MALAETAGKTSSDVAILVITFRMATDDSIFDRMAEDSARAIARFPGLIGKAYLADSRSNTYGGVYFFVDRSAAEAYLDSEIVRALRRHPGVTDFTTRLFRTVERATRVTQGSLPIVDAA